MAKVLYVVPDGNDLGGIITSSEELMQGFREAGHEATFVLLKHSHASGGAPRGAQADDYVFSKNTGMWMHPIYGWRGNYMTTKRPKEFVALANQHDVVVWGALYGLRHRETEGKVGWVKCITGHRAKNVFMVRDDHLEARIPWALALAPYAAAWAGVQRCSYDSLKGLGAPRAIVFSGHGPAMPQTAREPRETAALALATWKPWKRGRLLLQSSLHITRLRLMVAGDGIEFRYMRSPDKARDRDYLPDGRKLWDAALENGVEYLGPISPDKRDRLLSTTKFMVDFSYRENSGQINRTFVEAMRFGAVPIVSPRFVGEDIFKPGIHYLPVDVNASPEEVAAQLDKHARLSASALSQIRSANYEHARQFNRREAANNLVKLGLGKRAGLLYDVNPPLGEKLERGRAAFTSVFGKVKL